MKIKLIIIFLLSLSNLIAQNRDLIDQYLKELETSYKQKSNSKLENFLNNWNYDLKSNYPNDKIPNDTIKIIYDVYNEFYKPFDLLELGNWEWGNELNSNSRFALIQNKIYYNIVSLDSIKSGENKYKFEIEKEQILKKDSIIDFRPKLFFENHKVLFLTPEYKIALNKFLGTINKTR